MQFQKFMKDGQGKISIAQLKELPDNEVEAMLRKARIFGLGAPGGLLADAFVYIATGDKADVPNGTALVTRLPIGPSSIFVATSRPANAQVLNAMLDKVNGAMAQLADNGHRTFEFGGDTTHSTYYLYDRQNSQFVELKVPDREVQWMEYIEHSGKIELRALTRGEIYEASITVDKFAAGNFVTNWTPWTALHAALPKGAEVAGIRLVIDKLGRTAEVITNAKGVLVKNAHGYKAIKHTADLGFSSEITIDTANNELVLVRDRNGQYWRLADMFEAAPYAVSIGGDKAKVNKGARTLLGPETRENGKPGVFIEHASGSTRIFDRLPLNGLASEARP